MGAHLAAEARGEPKALSTLSPHGHDHYHYHHFFISHQQPAAQKATPCSTSSSNSPMASSKPTPFKKVRSAC